MPLSSSDKTIVLNSISSVRNIEDAFIGRLESTLRGLEVQINDLMEVSKEAAAVDVALARADLERILLDSDYFDTFGELLNEGYQEVIDIAYQDYLKIYGEEFQFTPTSIQRLDAMKQLDLSQFSQLADDAMEAANRLIIDVNFGVVDIKTATTFLKADIIDKLDRYAKTWITTALAAITREASTMLAKDNGITEFQYLGPMDTKTRPFCAEHLFEVKTQDEWNELDNGQIVPVFQYQGGYNCRHKLVGVR
jgi:hypothetical protein